jgi:cytochrome c peroxidase
MQKLIIVVFLMIPLYPLTCLGQETKILQKARQIFGILPKQMVSEQNPITPEKVTLGRMLFYETRISIDATVSCARCHPMSFYAADRLEKSIGNGCKVNPRNAPTLLNAAGQISQHWIGNRKDVEDQARQAIIGPPSFGMPSIAAADEKLRGIHGYKQFFEKAFPKDKEPVSIDNFAKAIGAFERTLTTPGRFDSFLQGKPSTLDSSEKSGLAQFMEIGCAHCHYGPCLGGGMYEKFGNAGPYWNYTGSTTIDKGRYAVTGSDSDLYVFKVPLLRNVAMTSPYFHDGSVHSLSEAIGIMAKAQLSDTLDDAQIGSLLHFLKSLTGDIPAEAQIAPILPLD